jgi:hypothetical protein
MLASGPSSRLTVLLPALLAALACAPDESTDEILTAHMPLHLEEHLDAARIEGSGLPPGKGLRRGAAGLEGHADVSP